MGKEDVVLLKIDGIEGSKKEAGVIVKLLASGENVSLSLLQAEPGKSFELHNHEEEELSFVIKGKAIMAIEGKAYRIEPYTVIKVPPNIKHGLKVVGTNTLLKLNAHSPPRK